MKTLWLYGRSGAGKTTLAQRLRGHLHAAKGAPVLLLDGDDVRLGLCRDLRFGSADRIENHRRVAEVARLAALQGIQPIVATMAPEFAQRDAVRAVLGDDLAWILVDAPIEVCIARDPKGLYRQARAGAVSQLIDFPFDPPRAGENLHRIDTSVLDIQAATRELVRLTADLLRNPAEPPCGRLRNGPGPFTVAT